MLKGGASARSVRREVTSEETEEGVIAIPRFDEVSYFVTSKTDAYQSLLWDCRLRRDAQSFRSWFERHDVLYIRC